MGKYEHLAKAGATIFIAVMLIISGIGPFVGNVKADGPTALEPSTLPMDDKEGVTELRGEIKALESLDPDAIALLIQDVNPWWGRNVHDALLEFGIPHDVINSSSLATWDLSKYKFILYASSQTDTYYANIAANLDKISSWVSDGGLLIAHCLDGGWYVIWPYQIVGGDWQGLSILPGGVTHLMHGDDIKYASDMIHITQPNHGVIKSDEYTLTDSYMAIWYTSTGGIFTNLPPNAEVIMVSNDGDGGDGPTYIDYNYGSGKVLATMNTVEWGYYNGLQYFWGRNRPELLRNELRYALNWTSAQHTHEIAFIAVKYKGWSESTTSISDLKNRAKMVVDYYNQQSYGKENLGCTFLFDDWASLPKTYEEYGSPPENAIDDIDLWYAIRDYIIDDLLWQQNGINAYDYPALVIIQPHCMRSFDGHSIVTSDKESYGTWAHEIGHAVFFFNDYYDDSDTTTDTWGNIQYWGLMGSATLMNPTTPIMSYNKERAGWLTYETINKGSYGEIPDTITLLKDLNLEDKVYRYEAGTKAVQYYIFEGRQPPDDIIKDNLVPPNGYCNWKYPDDILHNNKGILLYKVTPDNGVYSVPHQILPWFNWTDENEVTLTPGDVYQYQDDESRVKFTASERNGQLYVDISANPLSSQKVISLFDTSWEIANVPIQSEPIPSQWHFDLDLHAYAYDGREIGMDYATGEYKVQIADARTTFNTPGGGPEWISLPEDENVYYVIDPTPAREWANELGVEVENIKALWEIVYYDEEGTRKESAPITLDISLEKPAVVGLPATVDVDPNTLNLKSTGQWITCYIELPGGYDVNNIDLSTVFLNETIPAESNLKYGFVKNPEISDIDKDGLPELLIKFNRAAVQETVQPADTATISVTGEVLKNEIPVPFQGIATVRVISPGK
jgi:hypothetical protein